MHPQLMGAAGLWDQPQQGQAVPRCQHLVVGDGGLAVGPDTPGDGGGLIPPDGRVDGAPLRRGAADADCLVLPVKLVRVKVTAEKIVDIAAFRNHHQSGGALVQPVDRVKYEVRAPTPGQSARHGGGVRQEVGGVGRHARGLVYHQQVAVLPHDGQGPVAGGGQDFWRAVVAGFHS